MDKQLRRFKACIRNVPDFPKPGIVFRDITPLIRDPEALRGVVRRMADLFREQCVDLVVGIESRGFIFGPAVAMELGVGFVPLRKPGKLPAETVKETYELEYGTDAVEIHADAVEPGQKVLLLDDLLATGGTMAASCRLIERLGGEVAGVVFLVELDFLKGRSKLARYNPVSLLHYESE